MNSIFLYTLLIALTAIERLYELRVSLRNATWSFEHGGKEFGKSHYPFMVVLHTALLISCVAEVYFLQRPFYPVIGSVLFVLAILCQVARWWCISALGKRWNTRVIIVPGLPRVTSGPYRFLSHPNYVVVISEGIILPMVHNAWITATAFTILNAILLSVRIRIENQALAEMETGQQTIPSTPLDSV